MPLMSWPCLAPHTRPPSTQAPRLTLTTSFLLSSLKWAVPTTYTRLPSSATSWVTVRGSRGCSRRRFIFISRSRLKASTSAVEAAEMATGAQRWRPLTPLPAQQMSGSPSPPSSCSNSSSPALLGPHHVQIFWASPPGRARGTTSEGAAAVPAGSRSACTGDRG